MRTDFWASPRAAILAVFFAMGTFVGSHVGAFPVLLERGDVTPGWFGIYQFLNMLTAFAGMAVAGQLNRWYGHRTVLLTVLPVLCALMCVALFAQTGFQFALSLMVLGFIFSILDLYVNAEATYVEEEARRPLFGQFHACVALAIAVTGLASGMLSRWVGPSIMILPMLVTTPAAVFLVWRNIADRPPQPRRRDGTPAHSLPYGQLSLLGAAMGLGMVCELVAITWSGAMLTAMRPDWAAYSGLGIAFFGLCVGLMRLASDAIRARIGDYALLRNSLAVCALSFVVLALSSSFLLSVIAFAGVGAGIAMLYPCLIAAAGRLVPHARASAMGFAATVMSPPRIVMPLLLGWLATQAGFPAVYAASAACAAVGLSIVMLTLKPILERP